MLAILQSIDNKVISRIYGHRRGWAFTKIDFEFDFDASNIHESVWATNKSPNK